jgi:hypothetical protein
VHHFFVVVVAFVCAAVGRDGKQERMGNCGLKPKALGDDEAAAPAPAPAEAKGEEVPAVEAAEAPAEETSRAVEVGTTEVR